MANKAGLFETVVLVHVTPDLARFRTSLPGQQHDLPMLNIQEHLAQLKAGYRIELIPGSKTGRNGEALSQLTGVKKSKEIPGPKEIEIWFDGSAGSIHWMLLDELPRGAGRAKINFTRIGRAITSRG